MKTILSLLSMFAIGTVAVAQVTDGGFEAGTFNSSVRFGPTAAFVSNPAEAYEGTNFGAISIIASSTGSLRTLTSFDAGLVEPGGVYSFSFFAKRPEANGFSELNISASGGGPDAVIGRVTLEAPTSLTAVWMIHSYQFTIPENWNSDNILRISLSTEPISAVAGQTYSFHLDNFTLTLLDATAVPEPTTAVIGAGFAALACGVLRRRRSLV